MVFPNVIAGALSLADRSFAEAQPEPNIRIPHYLMTHYWWAYVHPRAVWFFERQWLVNLILWGNYKRLRDAAIAELGDVLPGSTLQVACAYGDLTSKLVGNPADQLAGKIAVGARHLQGRAGKHIPQFRDRCIAQPLVIAPQNEVDQPLPLEEPHRPGVHIGPPVMRHEIVRDPDVGFGLSFGK